MENLKQLIEKHGLGEATFTVDDIVTLNGEVPHFWVVTLKDERTALIQENEGGAGLEVSLFSTPVEAAEHAPEFAREQLVQAVQ